MDPQRFDELVSDALDLIPPELTAAMDNVVVLVADRHPEEGDLLGLYDGLRPKFVKRYAELGVAAREAIAAYCTEDPHGKPWV